MDFNLDTDKTFLQQFFRRRTPSAIPRSQINVNALRKAITNASTSEGITQGLRLLGLLGHLEDLPLLCSMCHHTDRRISVTAARTLLYTCSHQLSPILPRIAHQLPDHSHYEMLRELGEWLDIRFAHPSPVANHHLLLKTLEGYFFWLIEEGKPSRQLQTVMLLCRSGQRQFLSQMVPFLALEKEIPLMDWDDLFWVKDFFSLNHDRTTPLRSSLMGWLDELDRVNHNSSGKSWFESVKSEYLAPPSWFQAVEQEIAQATTLARQAKAQYKREDSTHTQTFLQQHQKRSTQHWVKALCQRQNRGLANEASHHLIAMQARSCLPEVFAFIKEAYLSPPDDVYDGIFCGEQLLLFEALGDSSWVPAFLTFVSEQKLVWDDQSFMVKEIIGPWLLPEHLPLVWQLFCSTTAQAQRRVLLNLLCFKADRAWIPTFTPLLEHFDEISTTVILWLRHWVKPKDFLVLKSYLEPEHPVFKTSYILLKYMQSPETRQHCQTLLDTYVFSDNISVSLSAIVWPGFIS